MPAKFTEIPANLKIPTVHVGILRIEPAVGLLTDSPLFKPDIAGKASLELIPFVPSGDNEFYRYKKPKIILF